MSTRETIVTAEQELARLRSRLEQAEALLVSAYGALRPGCTRDEIAAARDLVAECHWDATWNLGMLLDAGGGR